MYTVRRAGDVTTQVCSVGQVKDASSTAPSADSKAALTQNMATARPNTQHMEHVEVQHWEIDPAEPVVHFDFKYRDPEAMHLERQRAGMVVAGTGGGGGGGTAAKAQGGASQSSTSSAAAAAAAKSLFVITQDGVLELGDSDSEGEPPSQASMGGGVRQRDEGAMKQEPDISASPAKRARPSTSHDMLDLTGSSVRESRAVAVELYHETGGAVLTKLTPALVEAPAPDDAYGAQVALGILMQQAEEFYKDALVGTPFLATVQQGVGLFSALGQSPVHTWGDVLTNMKHGLIVRPAKTA